MGLMRTLFLAGSRSVWLRERATRYAFVRRSVSRFMPGETLDDALVAARALQDKGMSSVLTQLGENVADADEADAVKRHYLDVLEQAAARGLDAQISVKLTQLGLDLDPQLCRAHLEALLEARGGAPELRLDRHGELGLRGRDAGSLPRRARAVVPRRRLPPGLPAAHARRPRGPAAAAARAPPREGRLPGARGPRVPPQEGRGRGLPRAGHAHPGPARRPARCSPSAPTTRA